MLDIKMLSNIFYLLSMGSFLFLFFLRNKTKSYLGIISKVKQRNLNEHQDMPEARCLREGPLTKLVTPGLI